jgi:multidrug transporter EmrE-like cation transporter
MKITIAIILCILASILSFIQLQGQMVWKFPKDNPYIMMLLGLPISLVFINTTRLFNEHFEANWPGRLIGFGVGIIMFTIMSWVIFREHPTPKTITCLVLAFGIVAIQIFGK